MILTGWMSVQWNDTDRMNECAVEWYWQDEWVCSGMILTGWMSVQWNDTDRMNECAVGWLRYWQANGGIEMNECTVERHWQATTAIFCEQPAPVPICLLRTTEGLVWEWNLVSTVRGRLLTINFLPQESACYKTCWSEHRPRCIDVVGVVKGSADPSRRVITNPEISTVYGTLL